MRIITTLFLIGISLGTYAQDSSPKALVDSGVVLHDQQDYSGAIKLYDQAIEKEPTFHLAYLEKSLSLFAGQQYQECADLCKYILKKFPGEDNENVYVNYGSSLDVLGKAEEALDVYDKGLKKYPESQLLYFNKGVTCYTSKKYEDAVELMKKSVSLKPTHASSHQFLAYSISNNKLAAVMSLATFLIIEPEGRRAEKNLKIMLNLLGSNVEKKDDKNITISLDPGNLNVKGPDNFRSTELLLSFSAALDYSTDSLKLKWDVAQKLKKKIELLEIAGESNKPDKRAFFTNFYVPFFKALKAADHMEAACYIMYASGKDEEVNTWLKNNTEKTKALYEWLREYNWRKQN